MNKVEVPIEELRIGHHITLPKKWWSHPFLLNSFRIKDKQQLKVLHQLGLTHILVDMDKSSVNAQAEAASTAEITDGDLDDTDGEQEAPSLDHRCRVALTRSSNEYQEMVAQLRTIFTQILLHPEEMKVEIELLLGRLVALCSTAEHLSINLVTSPVGGDRIHHNALNTLVMVLQVARLLGLSEDEMKDLGKAVMFHDFGEFFVPEPIRNKTGELTKPEVNYLKQHPLYTVNKLKDSGLFDKNQLAIMLSHHEMLDGKGYPNGLAGNKIPPYAKLLGIVDKFDDLINNRDREKSLTGNLAVSYLFKFADSKYDKQFVNLLIKQVGLYPPGCLVQLGELYGLVVFASADNIKQPLVLLYDPDNREKPLEIIDTAVDSRQIDKCVKPLEVPDKVLALLAPPAQMNFYFSDVER